MCESFERRVIEVKLLAPFPIVKETLTRIGIRSKYERKLWPSCYVYNTRLDGKTYIAHFKELLKNPDMSNDDDKRKNTIIWILIKWGLIDIEDEKLKDEIITNIQERKLCILSKQQLIDECWEIIPKVHDNVIHYHIMNGMPRNKKE